MIIGASLEWVNPRLFVGAAFPDLSLSKVSRDPLRFGSSLAVVIGSFIRSRCTPLSHASGSLVWADARHLSHQFVAIRGPQ